MTHYINFFGMISLMASEQAFKPPNIFYSVSGKQAQEMQWTLEKWNKIDDSKYRMARLKLDQLYSDGETHISSETKLKKDSQKNPKDRFKLFLWGYSEAMEKRNEPYTNRDMSLWVALNSSKSPYNYEFIRMRYLYFTIENFGNDYSADLGERLIKADPKDYETIYAQSRNLSPDANKGRKKIFDYVDRLLVLNPNRASAYLAYIKVYNIDYIESDGKNIDAARKCVLYAQEYLKHTSYPQNSKKLDGMRAMIVKFNEAIQKAEKKP